jgi:hypothetical protein
MAGSINRDVALAVAELERRRGLADSVAVREMAFPKQRAYLDDRARFKSLLCPRRSAKTFTGGLVLVGGAQKNPTYSGLFMGLTFDSVRSTFWIPVILPLVERLGWPDSCLNHSRLELVAPSGGRVRCVGGDATPKETKKQLGTKNHDVVIDEAAAWQQDLRGLISKDIRPTLTDYLGTLHLMSTPSDIAKGLYYDVTTGAERGWSNHRWHPRDNPHVAAQWEEDHRLLLESNPLIVHTPAYKQMWLGEWCIDQEALVYKYSEARNLVTALPKGAWTFVMGVDLGWDDATAFVILAWSEYDKTVYICHAEAESGLDFTAVAQRIRKLQATWGVTAVVIDGASAQGVEEMIARHQLGLIRAEKPGKYDYQRLMNSDLLCQQLMLVDSGTKPLQKEMAELIWDPKKLALSPPKFVEHPRLPNHCCDAALYAWRYCYGHAARPELKPAESVPGNEEHERLFKAALERAAGVKNTEDPAPDAVLDEPGMSPGLDIYGDETSGLW